MKAWMTVGGMALILLAGCHQAADLAGEEEQREQYEFASELAAEAHANNPMRDRTPEQALTYLRAQEGGASEESIARYRDDLVSFLIAEGIDPNRADVAADRFIEQMREEMTVDQ